MAETEVLADSEHSPPRFELEQSADYRPVFAVLKVGNSGRAAFADPERIDDHRSFRRGANRSCSRR